MSYDEEQEMLYLLRDNNRMLKEIIAYINLKESQSDNENINDFFRNIVANMISSNFELNSFENENIKHRR